MSEKKFEPIYNIPSMEELDRQWKESQNNPSSGRGRSATNPARGNGSRSSAQRTSNRGATANHSAKTAQGATVKRTGNAGRGTTNTGNGSGEKRGRKRKKFKKLHMFLKVVFLILLLAILGVLIVLYFKYGDDLLRWQSEAKTLVRESNRNTFRSSETSIIYDSKKQPIAKLRGDKDSAYINFEDIPQTAIDCMLVTEDREFYEHSGVNLLSFGKAAALYIKGKLTGSDDITRGGSTITQQVAKNVFLSNEQTEERKIREIFIALEMERKYTKDEIMEFYLNVICFGNAHFGIEAASKAYFSKSAKDLDLAEIAFLCAIPNRPSYYDPLQHFDNCNSRKVRILDQLLAAEKITAAEYSDAKYEQIILNPAEAIKTQDYTTTFAIACATKALMKHRGFVFENDFSSDAAREAYDKEYNAMYEECNSLLYTGGYQIYTSLSNAKQKKLQKAVNSTLAGFKEKTKDGIYSLQGAATCIDNQTGFVVAIVGGRRQKDTVGYTLNRGFQSYRQPGSCFKPLVVYTPQLEREYTPNSIVDDTYFEGGPKNSSGTYSGKIPLRYAVEQSKNVIAWKLFEELTPRIGLSYVLKMGFSQIVDSDYYPAASLGGLTHGVSTVEMASAYAAIENDGVFREPTCVKKITDSQGNVIINNAKEQEKKQVYEETASRMMTDILSGVLIRGTARGNQLSNNMACAGKTGTTSDKKDGWFCGFTPYYTTTVWVGCDSPKTISDLYGNTYPLRIWKQFMEEIHVGLEPIQFENYEGKVTHNEEDEEETIDQEEPTMDPDAMEVTETESPETSQAPEVMESPEISQPSQTPQIVQTPKPTKAPKPTKTPKPTPDEPIMDIPEDDPGEDDIIDE